MDRYLKSGAALASTVVLLAGCGGSSTPDRTATFKSGFAPVVNQFKSISQGIGAAIQAAPSQTDAQITSTFRTLSGRWQTELSQLQTLKPPSSMATTFNTLTSSAARAEADLTAIVAAAETHGAAAAKQASASLVTDVVSAKSAATTLTSKLGIK